MPETTRRGFFKVLAGVGALAIAPIEIAAGGAKAIWDSSKLTYPPEDVIIWIDGVRIYPGSEPILLNLDLNRYRYTIKQRRKS